MEKEVRAAGTMADNQDTEKIRETRTIRFIASTSAKDRHRTVLNQKNWKLDNFNRNPIVGYQHNVYGDMCAEPNPDDVLGKARAFVENDILYIDITFENKELNPKADKIFEKLLNGSLNAVSVGFLEVGKGKYGEGDERMGGPSETYYFDGQELLEISVVNIPSNPEALKKSIRNNTATALMFLHRNLNKSFAEIENMTVGDVMRSLQNTKEVQSTIENTEEIEKLKRKNKAIALLLDAKATYKN